MQGLCVRIAKALNALEDCPKTLPAISTWPLASTVAVRCPRLPIESSEPEAGSCGCGAALQAASIATIAGAGLIRGLQAGFPDRGRRRGGRGTRP